VGWVRKGKIFVRIMHRIIHIHSVSEARVWEGIDTGNSRVYSRERRNLHSTPTLLDLKRHPSFEKALFSLLAEETEMKFGSLPYSVVLCILTFGLLLVGREKRPRAPFRLPSFLGSAVYNYVAQLLQ
jgi:hypothetical protein